MSVGVEWIVDATGCQAEALRDVVVVTRLMEQVIRELDLRVVGDGQRHKFGGEGGVTALYLLSESHLACHTYPELGVLTINLYCCKARKEWPWREALGRAVGATTVTVRSITRALGVPIRDPEEPRER